MRQKFATEGTLDLIDQVANLTPAPPNSNVGEVCIMCLEQNSADRSLQHRYQNGANVEIGGAGADRRHKEGSCQVHFFFKFDFLLCCKLLSAECCLKHTMQTPPTLKLGGGEVPETACPPQQTHTAYPKTTDERFFFIHRTEVFFTSSSSTQTSGPFLARYTPSLVYFRRRSSPVRAFLLPLQPT